MELEERQRPPLSRISTANSGINQEICRTTAAGSPNILRSVRLNPRIEVPNVNILSSLYIEYLEILHYERI